ncbi:hypothetical protein KKC22_03775 [Myxococcota bacterium]|nr:hypothetical protein [Myxococcota bacterium]
MRNLWILAVVFATLLPACAATTAQKKNLALKRATFDLNCPRDQMNIVDLSNDTYGVAGCNQRATYLVQCETGLIESCKAILNSSKKPE